ncbi:Gfo/Idh/MocA family oxidoreductase [bacterium]|nr:Gfo/Idh/MocA family oxidoreductase [bacterium]
MYKAVIIGFGKIGKLRARLIDSNENMTLDSICDISHVPDMERYRCPVFKDYREVLKRAPDIVFVCTSNDLLAKVVIEALDCGCHVFSEKPPGRNVAETKAMIDAENRNPELKLKFGFNHRYHDSVMQAHRLATGGRFGKILSVRGVYGKSGGVGFEKEWRNQRRFSGGGILLDQGIHMLDLMMLFCGNFTEIKSFVDNLHWNIDVEDNTFALMRNEENQIGMILSSATQWKHTFNLEIILEDGYLALRGILSGSMTYGKESLVIARKTYDPKSIGNPHEETYYYDIDNSWEREISEFIECITLNKAIKIGNSQDALKVMELVRRIYASDNHWVEKHDLIN